MTLLSAPTLAGVTQQGVSYVIGQGSSKTTLEWALRGLDGTLVLHGTVGTMVAGTFGVP